MKFEPKIITPIIRPKRVSRTYRFSPNTITLIEQAIKGTPFRTATSFIEEATTQFAEYILKEKP